MGTFHHGKGDLHGITVVVETFAGRVYVGRCDTQTPAGVLLLDADHHDEEAGKPTKAAWLARAAKVGVWKRVDRVLVPAAQVASVRPLAALRGT